MWRGQQKLVWQPRPAGQIPLVSPATLVSEPIRDYAAARPRSRRQPPEPGELIEILNYAQLTEAGSTPPPRLVDVVDLGGHSLAAQGRIEPGCRHPIASSRRGRWWDNGGRS
jgi:hypothetical protein